MLRFSKTFCVLAFSFPLFAASIVEEFDSATYVTTEGTAVLNLATGKVHVPFIVDRDNNVTEAEDDAIPIGDGSDGIFDTLSQDDFDTDGVSDTTITLDSSRVYEFTTFLLATGYTIRATGTSPLRIRVQGDATIQGTIDVSGGNGGSISTTGAATGGTACCGGSAGGGSATVGSGSGPGGAGIASASGGNGSGGGGGGGFESAPFNAAVGDSPAGGGAGGAAGTNYSNEYLATLTGGSGGGGGGNYALGVGDSYGGGGGGGGGAVFLTVGGDLEITATGQVRALGGNGGGSGNGALLAGSGGGGAGGAIVIFMGGAFTLDGSIDASQGTKGSGSGGGDGGDGSLGRTRVVANTDPGSWGGAGPLNPNPNMLDFGQSFYSKQSYTLYSTVFDTGNSSPTYTSIDKVETVPAGDTLTYEFAGSSDNFESDDTGWKTDITELSGKRYIKYRLTLQSSNRASSPEVRKLTINYDEHTQATFLFGFSACAATHSNSTSPGAWIFFVLGLLLIPRFSSFRTSRRRM